MPLADILSVMADATEKQFNEALLARTKQLREGLGWSQAEMAKALGVPPANYQKYETRTPLPYYLLERFALIVRRDISYVLTGRQARALSTESAPQRRRVEG